MCVYIYIYILVECWVVDGGSLAPKVVGKYLIG